jgi:hypothetical protein
MSDIKKLHDIEAECQHIAEVMEYEIRMNQGGNGIIYDKHGKREALKNLRKKADLRKYTEQDDKKGTIDIVCEGDWATPVPWPIVIAGKALKHGTARLWLCLMYHARRQDEEKYCFPSAARLAGMR